MAPLGEVEFFTDDCTLFATDQETMDFGPRTTPRGARALAVVAVIAVASTLATKPPARHSGSAKPSLPTSAPPAVGRIGPALRWVGGAADALDAVIHRAKLYVLRAGSISVVNVATRRVESTMQLVGNYSVAYQSVARLLFDADADRLWVVAKGEHSARLIEIEAARMVPVRGVTVRFAVQDAAAMGGHLYLATSAGLADLAPGAADSAVLPGVAGAVSAVAADPRRHRILALDTSTPGAVVVVSHGQAAARRIFGNLFQGTIAVVGDEIWVGGSASGSRAIIARLDPVTLAAVQTSSVALRVTRVIVSPGAHSVWVSTGGRGLWCVDADNGDILEQWPSAAAPVTSEPGVAYTVDAGSIVPLIEQGCTG
ncbi:MAG: hypothetical protein ABR604_05410 [Jatrophihabitantaceae bacterium]